MLPREGGKGLPPVDLWNPPFCGDIDMRIAADGTWFYQKTPIGRPALVKLFASVLKREGDKYFLVTPVEKVGIVVDDAPFLAVELKVEYGEARAAPAVPHQCGRLGDRRPRPCHALRRGCGEWGLETLPACPPRPVGQGDAGACFTIWSNWARSATSAARRCSALRRQGEFFPMVEASALREFV